ncbi:hypothetical protein GTW69_07400 [Streptomyces sp. SID7760]|nr:hypothetical protein [Streptomyces sp. SID7760]
MSQRPAPAFAYEEQHRAEGLAQRAAAIAAEPDHPSRPSLGHYREFARLAFEAAAAHAEQPEGRP